MASDEKTSVARNGAILVKSAFERYRSAFRRITRASQQHFEAADWRGIQRDMQERLGLYPVVVREAVAALENAFGAATRDEALWSAMKVEFTALTAGRGDLELAETFYNSVTRKVWATVGVRADREYVGLEPQPTSLAGLTPARTYPGHPLG